ncbi:hypothetical protein NL676_012460 [Syzygium grande]|nr:hypothetical protein NL676_012460 [Syzygium grande]
MVKENQVEKSTSLPIKDSHTIGILEATCTTSHATVSYSEIDDALSDPGMPSKEYALDIALEARYIEVKRSDERDDAISKEWGETNNGEVLI